MVPPVAVQVTAGFAALVTMAVNCCVPPVNTVTGEGDTVIPTGCGDVRVWPSRNRGQGIVCIALSSPEGEALLEAPARALESFLKRTNAAVAPGSEHRHYDIDSELAHLFADN